MQTLNLPTAELRLRETGGKPQVFDPVRKKFVSLTPEEWVRQHFIQYLIREKKVPSSLLAVEMQLTYHRLKKRSDLVVFGRKGKPLLMVECKAPEVPVTEEVFQQVATYNMTLKVPYLVVTNGLEHYACRIDIKGRSYRFLKEIPEYPEMEAGG
ncbi:MAG TPA: type I restriction enzyme HsdR N-terminal domain-containing protein [Bacteroidales bacterium]|nr:type I restriction enzyme HsdR N-terminal domain-containing protein [Bacteroidales bacterium]